MRNPAKFGSPKLDTPNLRYEFKSSHTDNWGPLVSGTRTSDTQKQSTTVDRREFTIGEVSNGSIYTATLYSWAASVAMLDLPRSSQEVARWW